MQPVSPCPALAHWWQRPSVWATSPLALVFRHIFCGGFVFLFFPGYVALWNSRTPHRPTCERVSYCLETSLSWLSPRNRSLSLNLLSLFVFCILSYLLLNRMGRLSGCLVSSASVQKLFCGSCSAFKWYFDEFWGEKVVSPTYSSTIVGPPPKI